MKKLLIVSLALFSITGFISCSNSGETTEDVTEDTIVEVVDTVFTGNIAE